MEYLWVEALKCEYRTNPLGIDRVQPRISWELRSDRRGTLQSGYRMIVAGPNGDFDVPLWDTGIQKSSDSIQIPYEGPELKSRTRYFYKVKVWDNFGKESAWSETAWWEMALLESEEWKAHWITPDMSIIDPDADPAFLLRKRFELEKEIVSARVYSTAAGVYELYINGSLVSVDLLAPGWTSYHHRLQYQTYDVTDLLQTGGNAIGMMLGDGWYRSDLGFESEELNLKYYRYGNRRAALIQLHVTYRDGTESVIVTDPSWKSSPAPVLYSTIYNGETYDARLEQEGWNEAYFNDEKWQPTETINLLINELVAQENWPIRVIEILRPISTFITPAGDHILDMGQNMVGRVRFSTEAKVGTKIVLQHAEVLDKDGNIYFDNLRSAKQRVQYIAKGTGRESYAAYFTFQGFRYVKVEGFPDQENGLPLDAFVGEVIHSEMNQTGKFECSDESVNQLQRNIQWGQRGNFLDVPTDCPQRDERLGWTGDAQVFMGTALFNYQGGPFFTKWLHDLKADQFPNGGVPVMIPNIGWKSISSAWGDAAVICPWTVYQYYGDKRLLSEQYESMKAWIEYIRAQGENEYLWNTGAHNGDWLALDTKEESSHGATPSAFISTAYYAYSTRIVRGTAAVLGYEEDARTYGELYQRIIHAFRDEFITKTGRIAAPTQTAHALALVLNLVDESYKSRVADDLNSLIADNDYHLSTGFVGTPHLCFALSEHGYHRTAIRLLLQESSPGWLYPVLKGATTIWEHWNGIKPDGSFMNSDMNSFNHYAFGAVGDWLYRKVAGLNQDPTVAAYKRILIEPLFGAKKLTWAKASHHSMYGRIVSGWTVNGNKIEMDVEIPVNSTAEIVLHGATIDEIKESGQFLANVNGILDIKDDDHKIRLIVGSGVYKFTYTSTTLFRVNYTANSRIDEILDDDAATEILKKHIPHLFTELMLKIFRKRTLKQLTEEELSNVTSTMVADVVKDLEDL